MYVISSNITLPLIYAFTGSQHNRPTIIMMPFNLIQIYYHLRSNGPLRKCKTLAYSQVFHLSMVYVST